MKSNSKTRVVKVATIQKDQSPKRTVATAVTSSVVALGHELPITSEMEGGDLVTIQIAMVEVGEDGFLRMNRTILEEFRKAVTCSNNLLNTSKTGLQFTNAGKCFEQSDAFVQKMKEIIRPLYEVNPRKNDEEKY
eukprot:Trichotokara_eunicae@DN5992_c0_g1_i3.p1